LARRDSVPRAEAGFQLGKGSGGMRKCHEQMESPRQWDGEIGWGNRMGSGMGKWDGEMGWGSGISGGIGEFGLRKCWDGDREVPWGSSGFGKWCVGKGKTLKRHV